MVMLMAAALPMSAVTVVAADPAVLAGPHAYDETGEIPVTAPTATANSASTLKVLLPFHAPATVDGHVGAPVATEGVGAGGGALRPVLLDTNAVIRHQAASALIGEGEEGVVSTMVTRELADVAARQGLSGTLPGSLGVIAEDTSIGFRMQMLQTLRMFGASPVGIEGDAAVGATGLAGNMPLITGDWALGNAYAKLGGEFGYLEP
jgi:hypothetical protein